MRRTTTRRSSAGTRFELGAVVGLVVAVGVVDFAVVVGFVVAAAVDAEPIGRRKEGFQ